MAKLKRKGVALIMALFATAILVTLSLAFLTLSIAESRTSRGAAQEKAALEAANYGLEFALNYMGMGTYPDALGAPINTWERDFYPGSFNFYNCLVRTPSPRPHLIPGTAVLIQNATDDPTLVQYSSDPNLQSSLRRLTLVQNVQGASGNLAPPVAPIALGSDWAYTFNVAIVPVLPSSSVESFRLISTAKVYSLVNGAIGSTPLTTRVIEAQVLPESASSYLHFISNSRGFAGQGIPSYSNQTYTDPGSGSTVKMADYVTIPPNFSENGPIRVDGENPNILNMTSADNGTTAWYNNGGNLDFGPGVAPVTASGNPSNVTFDQRLTINKPANDYQKTGEDDTNSGFFGGGFTTASPRLGLPLLDLANMTAASQFAPSPNPSGLRPAFYSVATSEIPGATGSSEAAPRSSPDPFYTYTTQTINGQPTQVPTAYDYRPRIPNVEVTLSGDQISVQKRDTLNGNLIGSADVYNSQQVSSGVLFVQGGNTVVKTGDAFTGQLSVTTGEQAGRTTMNSTTTSNDIYADAALQLYTEEKTRWDQARLAGTATDPSGYLTPPYTTAQLQAAKDSGIVTAPIPNTSADHTYWPSPAAGVNREANMIIADDVKTSSDRSATLGLFAQNFILINDNTPTANNSSIEIDAVLMSRDRNVGLDWDNTGRQGTWKNGVLDTTAWQTMTTPGFNGTINLKGSVIGEFIDVEGDMQGRGYPVQQFYHNPNLNNLRPPLSPSWDFSVLPGGFRFVITHFTDDGSLSTNGALP